MNYDEDGCPICFCELTEETKCTLINCGHTFCEQCVYSWIDESKENPECPLDSKEIIAIQSFDTASGSTSVKNLFNVYKPLFLDCYKKESAQLFDQYRIYFSAINEIKKLHSVYEGFVAACAEDPSLSSDRECWKKFDDISNFFQDSVAKFQYHDDFQSNLLKYKTIFYADGSKEAGVLLSTILSTLTLIDQIGKYRDIIVMIWCAKLCAMDLITDIRLLKYLKHGLDMMRSHFFLTKASFLAIGPFIGMSTFYEDSECLCLICSEDIQANKVIQMQFCKHSICIHCGDKYRIVNPKCIFGCGEREGRILMERRGYNGSIISATEYLLLSEKEDLSSSFSEYLKKIAEMSTMTIRAFIEVRVSIEGLRKEEVCYKDQLSVLTSCKDTYYDFCYLTIMPLLVNILELESRILMIGCSKIEGGSFKQGAMDSYINLCKKIYNELYLLTLMLANTLPGIRYDIIEFYENGGGDDVSTIENSIIENHQYVHDRLKQCAECLTCLEDINLTGFDTEKELLLENCNEFLKECSYELKHQ